MSFTEISVIICAAGSSSRMGRDKLLLPVDGMTVIEKTVSAFEGYGGTKKIVLAVSPERVEEFGKLLARRVHTCPVAVCAGGSARQDTVWNALCALGDEAGLIAVHDGARPFVSAELIGKTADAASLSGAALPVTAVKETVHLSRDGAVCSSLDRSALRAAQTPQIFRGDILRRAYENALAQGLTLTDECSAVLALGMKVSEVPGEESNIKITTPADLRFLKKENTMRIGHGYDVHRLVPDRKFILGGVEIPHELGLLGHSDADVLLHAIADAVLGALALGDIGKHFPDTDVAYAGISSLLLLEYVGDLAREKGATVVNVDATVCAQRPKLAPHIDTMRENIARALGLDKASVSVKATTEEKLGFTGREEGVSATAVCLVSED